MTKYNHLTNEDRYTTASKLKNRESFRSIGAAIEKDPPTVSKEVRNHIIFSRTGCQGHAFNNCVHRRG